MGSWFVDNGQFYCPACRSRNATPTGGEILTQYLPPGLDRCGVGTGFQAINIDEAGPNKEADRGRRVRVAVLLSLRQ